MTESILLIATRNLSRTLTMLAVGLLLGASPAFAAMQGMDMATDKHGDNSGTDKASDNADIGGSFTLIDQDGKTVTDTNFRGKFLLVYFGYTYCPDMCPTGLQSIARTMDKLGKDASKVQPLFITIDPARDTPAKLKEYAASFHPSIVSLTGSPDQIATVAKAYKVYYKKAEEVEDGEYIMDHSTGIYLMDANGKFVANFTENEKPATIASGIRAAFKKAPSKSP